MGFPSVGWLVAFSIHFSMTGQSLNSLNIGEIFRKNPHEIIINACIYIDENWCKPPQTAVLPSQLSVCLSV